MKKLSIVMFLIITLALPSVCLAASSTQIIGVATVKKGTQLAIIAFLSRGPTVGSVIAFEDQKFYIKSKIKADEKKGHRGGYMLIGDGFVHDCPAHGKEVMGECLIILPIEAVEDGVVSIKLF